MSEQQAWVTELTFATRSYLNEDQLLALDEDGQAHDWYAAPRADGPGLRISVYDAASDPVTLTKQAAEMVGKWLVEHGIDGEIVAVRTITESQREQEADAPTLPQLASAADVGELLGVSRQRVHRLAHSNPQFPEPLARLATGPVWDVKAIEWFGRVWQRKRGRPSKPAA